MEVNYICISTNKYKSYMYYRSTICQAFMKLCPHKPDKFEYPPTTLSLVKGFLFAPLLKSHWSILIQDESGFVYITRSFHFKWLKQWEHSLICLYSNTLLKNFRTSILNMHVAWLWYFWVKPADWLGCMNTDPHEFKWFPQYHLIW